MTRNEAIGNLYTAMHDLYDHENGEFAVMSIMCATVEELREGPLPLITAADHEAQAWAWGATTIQKESMLRALDRQLENTPMHRKVRKRIFATMFLSMDEQERAAALEWAQEQKK